VGLQAGHVGLRQAGCTSPPSEKTGSPRSDALVRVRVRVRVRVGLGLGLGVRVRVRVIGL